MGWIADDISISDVDVSKGDGRRMMEETAFMLFYTQCDAVSTTPVGDPVLGYEPSMSHAPHEKGENEN